MRDEWLTREGYKILRFGNRDILTARESVLATIAATVRFAVVKYALAHPPSPQARRGAHPFWPRLREKVARSAG